MRKTAKAKKDDPTTAAPGRVEVEHGIAWVPLDDPVKRVNTLNTRYFEWFEEQLTAYADAPLRALVFVSDKPGYFIAGADIEELQAMNDPAQVVEVIRRGHQLVGRFA